jgi:hypothetical protein
MPLSIVLSALGSDDGQTLINVVAAVDDASNLVVVQSPPGATSAFPGPEWPQWVGRDLSKPLPRLLRVIYFAKGAHAAEGLDAPCLGRVVI